MLSFRQKGLSEYHRKSSRLAQILSLTILGIIIIAVTIVFSDSNQILNNHTIWFENYFEGSPSNKLSQAQKDIIHNSARITSAVAEDAGVKVTLDSVTGNGYFSYYKVDIELPEGMNAGAGYIFDKKELLINDDRIGLINKGNSTMTLEDDNPTDNRCSLLLTTRLGYYPDDNYSFNNGIVRTLHLENLVAMNEAGADMKIEGK